MKEKQNIEFMRLHFPTFVQVRGGMLATIPRERFVTIIMAHYRKATRKRKLPRKPPRKQIVVRKLPRKLRRKLRRKFLD